MRKISQTFVSASIDTATFATFPSHFFTNIFIIEDKTFPFWSFSLSREDWLDCELFETKSSSNSYKQLRGDDKMVFTSKKTYGWVVLFGY